MKKRFFVYLFLIIFTGCAFAATYKVNTKGQVTSPAGKVQTQSNILYNNYYKDDYIISNRAGENGIYTIDIVMDYSGSMSYWIEAAKNAMIKIIAQIPSGVNVGFRVFGNDTGANPFTPILSKVSSVVKKENGKYNIKTVKQDFLGKTSSSCSATTSLAPVAPMDVRYLLSQMNSTNVGGMTPLTLALNQAVNIDFAGLDTVSKKKIILITDGDENCGGDPCAFAKALVQKRQDIVVDVVLVSGYSRELSCLTSLTGGRLYNPANGDEFVQSITNSIQNAPNGEIKRNTNNGYTQNREQKYEFIKE